jgi:hypothetical protein
MELCIGLWNTPIFFPEQISAQICAFSIVKEKHRQIPLPSELRNSGTISLTL